MLYIAYKRAGALTYVYKTYTYLFDDTLVIGLGLGYKGSLTFEIAFGLIRIGR